jgi:hypothetical protein
VPTTNAQEHPFPRADPKQYLKPVRLATGIKNSILYIIFFLQLLAQKLMLYGKNCINCISSCPKP